MPCGRGLVTVCIVGARDSSQETCAMTETVLVPLLLKRFLKKKAMNSFLKRLRLCPGNG
jgi:hypothetical protein